MGRMNPGCISITLSRVSVAGLPSRLTPGDGRYVILVMPSVVKMLTSVVHSVIPSQVDKIPYVSNVSEH